MIVRQLPLKIPAGVQFFVRLGLVKKPAGPDQFECGRGSASTLPNRPYPRHSNWRGSRLGLTASRATTFHRLQRSRACASQRLGAQRLGACYREGRSFESIAAHSAFTAGTRTPSANQKPNPDHDAPDQKEKESEEGK